MDMLWLPFRENINIKYLNKEEKRAKNIAIKMIAKGCAQK
jgi:hypothetical protein